MKKILLNKLLNEETECGARVCLDFTEEERLLVIDVDNSSLGFSKPDASKDATESTSVVNAEDKTESEEEKSSSSNVERGILANNIKTETGDEEGFDQSTNLSCGVCDYSNGTLSEGTQSFAVEREHRASVSCEDHAFNEAGVEEEEENLFHAEPDMAHNRISNQRMKQETETAKLAVHEENSDLVSSRCLLADLEELEEEVRDNEIAYWFDTHCQYDDRRDVSKSQDCQLVSSGENTEDEASNGDSSVEEIFTDSDEGQELSLVSKAEVSFEVEEVCSSIEDSILAPTASSSKIKPPKIGKQTTYFCFLCKDSFSQFSQLSCHIYLHTKSWDSIYDEKCCPLCEKVFRGRSNHQVDAHMRQEHNDPMPFKCHVCSKLYASYASIRLHKRLHYKCEECSKRFHKLLDLSLHMFQHMKLVAYNCHLCHRLFTDIKKLKTHLDSHVQSQESKSASVKSAKKCTVCHEEFEWSKELQIHMLKHPGEGPSECQVCKKVLLNRKTLMVHMRKHTGDKPHICKICNERFRTDREKLIHSQSHGGKSTMKCKFCTRHFTSRKKLMSHQSTHKEKKDDVVCDVCGKHLKSRTNLHIHMRIHTGERPYQCNECEEAFICCRTLKKHSLIHMRIKSGIE